MPSRKFLAYLAASSLPWLVGCTPEHELFHEVASMSGVSGAGGTSGTTQTPMGGSTGAQQGRSPVGGPCGHDSECESGTLCDDDTCRACAAAVSCRTGFIVVKRNGCDWCAPPNECVDDANCGEEMKCFPGLQCDAGCDGSPSCCHGNLCGEADCGPPIDLDCSVVGCADGASCTGSARFGGCECEDDGWHCETMEEEDDESNADGEMSGEDESGEEGVPGENQCEFAR